MGYEDFTTWIENDPSNRLTQTVTRSTFTSINRADNNTYLYKDYGLGYWTNFRIEFELYVSVCPLSSSSTNRVNVIAFVENELGDFYDTRQDNQMVNVMLEGNSATGRVVWISQRDGVGGTSAGSDIVISLSTQYYCTLIRSGTDLILRVFSDAARTIQVGGDSTTTCNIGDSYRYVMVPQSLYLAGNYYTTGYVQNLDMSPDVTVDLFAEFYVPPRGSADLKAEFRIKQDFADLKNIFHVGQDSANLYASFWIPIPQSKDLFSEFETNLNNGTPNNLFCKFAVRLIYDLSDQGGIGFFWEGTGRGHVDIQILTPTGAWIGKFPDYADWTWVELWWEDLQEVDIDGSRPDKTQITGFLWTYHSAGIRHLDGLYGLPKGPTDVKGIMVIRHTTYNELPAEFFYNHFRAELPAEIILRQTQPGRLPLIGGYVEAAQTAPFNWGSGDPYGLISQYAKKSFQALGRHWLIYCQGDLDITGDRELCFISNDGTGWTSKTLIPGVTDVGRYANMATYFDGVYLHVTYQIEATPYDLYYIRGTPSADGTISWGSIQTVKDVGANYLTIVADASGYPWIFYTDMSPGYATGSWVIKSSTNDGTWVTDFNIQYDTANLISYVMPYLLPTGQVLILQKKSNETTFRERIFETNGSYTSTVLDPIALHTYVSAMDVNDAIHVVSYNATTDKLYYRKRDRLGDWTTDIELADGLTDYIYPQISIGYGQDQGEIQILYYQDADLYWIRGYDEEWTTPEKLATLPYNVLYTEAPSKYSGGNNTFYAEVEAINGQLGIIYATKIRTWNGPLVKGTFEVGQGKEDLKAEFTLRQLTSDLKATFVLPESIDLYAQFRVEPHKNLKAVFTLRQLTADLKAVFEVGNVIDTYGAVGTGDDSIVSNTTWHDMEGMEITIPNVKAGDEFVLIYDGQTDPNVGAANWNYGFKMVYDLGAGEVQIGNDVRCAIQYQGYEKYDAFSRRLVAPSDGDYTFKVQWRQITSGSWTITSEDGLRNFIIMHIH